MTYLVAGNRVWNRATFDQIALRLPDHRWEFVDGSGGNAQVIAAAEAASPAAIFFLFWSWKLPAEFVARYRCVNFHPAPLPYGRGSSIVQHFILAGRSTTTLVAHRMTNQIDAGPILAAREVSLHGSASAIYARADQAAAEVIEAIIQRDPLEVQQRGDPVVFRRRTPDQSDLARYDGRRLDPVYDFIRMLDAEGYPHAYLDLGPLRLTFRRAVRYWDRIEADVQIRERGSHV